MANMTVEASLNSALRVCQQNQLKFPIQAQTQLAVTYLQEQHQQQKQQQQQQKVRVKRHKEWGSGKIVFPENKKHQLTRKKILDREELFLCVLKIASTSHMGIITYRKVARVLGYNATSKRLVLKLLKYGFIRPTTDSEKLSIARRQTHNQRANAYSLQKYIRARLSNAFIITDKGSRLYEILNEMNNLLLLEK